MPGHILEAPQAAFNAEESATQGRVGSINIHSVQSLVSFFFLNLTQNASKLVAYNQIIPKNKRTREHFSPWDSLETYSILCVMFIYFVGTLEGVPKCNDLLQKQS